MKAGKLPTFRGYTVDVRVKQFRRVPTPWDSGQIEFIAFDSKEGKELLAQYLAHMQEVEEIYIEII